MEHSAKGEGYKDFKNMFFSLWDQKMQVLCMFIAINPH